ncbi:beta-ketoacyl synthase N-terminal-like domain-containing protein [Desulfomarina sp.]
MKRRVVVSSGDMVTPLGDLQETWDSLMAGESGIVKQSFGSLSGEWPLGIIAETGVGAERRGPGDWQRLRIVFDRLFCSLPEIPRQTRLFCATTKGAVGEWMAGKGAGGGNPWEIADYLCRLLGLEDEATMVSGACASGSLAVIQGALAVSSGECDRALVVGFDLVAEFVLAGFDSLKALSPDTAKPFDINRRGLCLGDGAGWLLLEAEEVVSPDSCNLRACLSGWAVSCDATHITAPCRYGSGLKRAFDTLFQEDVIPVGGINGHGTGTVYNDAMELLAFREKCGKGIPVCSGKGALGHSLGGTGVVEALISTLSLEHGMLSPTVGLETAEETECLLSAEPLPLRYPSIISSNSGFGGINTLLYFTPL